MKLHLAKSRVIAFLAYRAVVGLALIGLSVGCSAATGATATERSVDRESPPGTGSVARAEPRSPGGPTASATPARSAEPAAGDAASADAHAEPRAPVVPPGPRLWSRGYLTWIWAKPQVKGRFLGTVRIGQSVALRAETKVVGQGCSKGFYQIEPRGYVCHDRTVTRSADTPFLRAVAYTLPRDGPFPYDYALSNGAPMYLRVPTEAERKRTEWRYGPAGEFKPLGMFQQGHEHLAITDPIEPADPLPAFLADGGSARGQVRQLLRRSIPHGSMLAYTRAFEADGRTFLLSADLTVVPADRVRRFKRSRFRGVKLGKGAQLPIGWFRVESRPRFRKKPGGDIAPATPSWPVRSWVHVAGEPVEQNGRRYVPVRPPRGKSQDYAAAADLTLVRAETQLPFGVAPTDKWLLVRISDGTLVAYEGLRPVFTTLISPGQGGVPIKGRDHVKFSTTPLGAFRITFKDRASTMSPEMGEDRSFWIADVPYTQYFNAPFALHAAYWHEKFGELMSGGCVNASPIDAKFLFEWTDPAVPDGWQGATGAGAKENGPSTWVVVRR